MHKNLFTFRTLYQIAFSALVVAALLVQFVHGLLLLHPFTPAFTLGKFGTYIALFFSYFTILSNIFVAIVLCDEARSSYLHRELSTRFQHARAAAVFCIFTTGIIYALFLRGPGGQGAVQDSIPWINSVFHYIMPAVMTTDWLAFPTQKKVGWLSILEWIGITLGYFIYVEILGLVSHVYPYFFLDPIKFHGYAGVLRGALTFIPFFVVFGAIIISTNRLRLRLSRKARL